MGIFNFRKQKNNEPVDVYHLFPEMHRDGRDLYAFCNYSSNISYDEFRAFDAVQHFDMMVDSIELILETKYPRTFFYRYRFAMENAAKVCCLDKHGIHGKKAKQTLDILCKNKADIVNAFLKRSYEAGKFPYVKEEILAERGSMPKESYEYFCQLINPSTRK